MAYTASEGTGKTPTIMDYLRTVGSVERTVRIGRWIIEGRLTTSYVNFPAEAMEAE